MPTNKWIQKAVNPKNKGKLRKALHVKKGQDIPISKLKKAEKSSDPTLRREAVLAVTLRKVKHPKKRK